MGNRCALDKQQAAHPVKGVRVQLEGWIVGDLDVRGEEKKERYEDEAIYLTRSTLSRTPGARLDMHAADWARGSLGSSRHITTLCWLEVEDLHCPI